MGGGRYDLEAHQALTLARAQRPAEQVFGQRACHPELDPRGVRFRESRDSAAHPDSVGVVFALDVSGSMGQIPHQLATRTLPSFMEAVLPILPDAQVLFMAFGNVYADRSPLQVGQFESEAALIDRWLSLTHLEGGGGGLGESYDLAMFFAAYHTVTDGFVKRGRKGYFFMTGDEVPFVALDPARTQALLGGPEPQRLAIHELAHALERTYHPFFLIPDPGRAQAYRTEATWRQLWDARVVVLADPEDTAYACALLVAIEEGVLKDREGLSRFAHERFALTGAALDRLVDAVAPYAEARARGPLPAPRPLGVRKDPEVVKG